MAKMVKQMNTLSVTDPDYAVLYYQCKHEFPMAAPDLPKPVIGRVAATVAFQQQPVPAQGSVNPMMGAAFMPPARKPEGCAFCMNLGHCIRNCHSAHDYVNRGLAVYHDGRIKL